MTTPSQSDKYVALSQVYIRQADEELAQEDYRQAGEKAWGALVTAIKAIAELRGWRHTHHDLTQEAFMWLADEYARPELKDYFSIIGDLHRNYYEDKLTEQEVEQGIGRTRRLLQDLETMRITPPPGVFTPESNRQKRRWADLTGRQWDDSRPE